MQLRTQCALLIQCSVRRRLALLLACEIATKVVEKIYDPRSESFYYYNVRLDKSRWVPPPCFGHLRREIKEVAPTYSKVRT